MRDRPHTRRTPGVGGRGSVQQNDSLTNSRQDRTSVRGCVVRFTGCHETDAAEIVERAGPVEALRLAHEVVSLVASIDRPSL